ncbi:MAG: DeoR/GlpR family DNA-binding transcription regulator [Eubacteriales bacterium]|nr:DeoR/GlpR family DNA-binding transcription regulator [Eubacteriales bacterium]
MATTKKSVSTPSLFAEERHAQILLLLQEKTKIHVPALCNTFSVSPATIRNDLRELERKGKLKRTHGGAIPMEKATFEPTTSAKNVENIDVKQRLAAYAATLIEEGDTIALDAGTTMLELAKCLCDRKALTVLTNDIRIATYLEQNSMVTIILIGGILRHGLDCTVGPIAISSISALNVDKAFIGANAFSVEKGFTTPDINQAEVKKALIRCASERIVLCDSSKFGRISFVDFASISDIDRLITDKNASPKIATYLREQKDNLEFITL